MREKTVGIRINIKSEQIVNKQGTDLLQSIIQKLEKDLKGDFNINYEINIEAREQNIFTLL
jgi:hypothetical protein